MIARVVVDRPHGILTRLTKCRKFCLTLMRIDFKRRIYNALYTYNTYTRKLIELLNNRLLLTNGTHIYMQISSFITS